MASRKQERQYASAIFSSEGSGAELPVLWNNCLALQYVYPLRTVASTEFSTRCVFPLPGMPLIIKIFLSWDALFSSTNLDSPLSSSVAFPDWSSTRMSFLSCSQSFSLSNKWSTYWHSFLGRVEDNAFKEFSTVDTLWWLPSTFFGRNLENRTRDSTRCSPMSWLAFIKSDNFSCTFPELNKSLDAPLMMVRWGTNTSLFPSRLIPALLNLYFRAWTSFDRAASGSTLAYKILLWNCPRPLNCSLWLGGRMDTNKGWTDLRILLAVATWSSVCRVNMSRVMCRCSLGISSYSASSPSSSWMVFWICRNKVMHIKAWLSKQLCTRAWKKFELWLAFQTSSS